MSWSANAVGRSEKVAAYLADQFAGITCAEPENTIKNGAASIVATALAAMPEGTAVRVEAYGSQYVTDSSKPEEAVNSLKIEITPIYGFLG